MFSCRFWRQLFAPRRQHRRQALDRQPRFVQEQATHFIEHKVLQAIPGPALRYQPVTNEIEALIAQVRGLA
jgi:hypothetical protein